MGVGKTEALSVRVEPRIKQALQAAAEREMRSLANMLEVMVVDYCRARSIAVDTSKPSAGDAPPVKRGRRKSDDA